MDDGILKRWMSLEMGKLHEGLVRVRPHLSDILLDAEPSAVTRGGRLHHFDPAALRDLADRLNPFTRSTLRVPMLFYLDHEIPGSAYVADEDAIRVLRETGAVAREPREGKLWVSEPLAREIARRWPTLVQFVSL